MGVKQTEAMKAALTALKSIDEAMPFPVAKFAIRQLKEALADHSTNRPTSRLDAYPKEQVAAAKEDVLSAVEHHGLSEQPAQPQQEPVAWMIWTHGPVLVFMSKDEANMEFDRLNHAYPEPTRMLVPLYTSPPESKPWMGLTNQELIDLTAIYSGAPLYCAIEAKLREKNT